MCLNDVDRKLVEDDDGRNYRGCLCRLVKCKTEHLSGKLCAMAIIGRKVYTWFCLAVPCVALAALGLISVQSLTRQREREGQWSKVVKG